MKVTGSKAVSRDWVNLTVTFPNGTVDEARIWRHDINPNLLEPVTQYGKIHSIFKSQFKTIKKESD